MAVKVLSVLLVASLVALGFGQKIKLSQNSFSLTSGLNAQVQFMLDAPIICPSTSATTECSVTVRITNMDTTAVAVDTCLIKWRSIEWSQIRTVTITAKPSFVDDAQKTVQLVLSAANSSSVYYSGFRASNITLSTRTRRSSQCSATGDPHYTSFDGAYFHFYDTVQNVVYRSTAEGRTFEIQARLWMPPYSRHCALAAREENDLVIIDQCAFANNYRAPVVTTRFGSPTGLTPRVSVNGVTYEVFFRSGAYMRADAYSWGMNVYFTAPGQDYNRTVGMCGNNNGIARDDNPMYVMTLESQLFPDQRMGTRQDLWTWYPSTSAVRPTLPPYAQECSTLDVPYIIPVLNNPNGQDITNLLKNEATPAPATLPALVIPTVTSGTTAAPTTTAAPVSLDAATTICRNAIANSSLVRDCTPIFVMGNDANFLTRFISGCAEDTAAMGVNPQWVAASMQDLQNACANLATRLQQTLSNTFCPTSNAQTCSGHGSCVNNTCICTAPFMASDCSIDSSLPPTISVLSQSACDVLGVRPCPDASISVSGQSFLNTANLTCKFNNTVVPAMYLGSREVWCNFPRFTLTGSSQNLYVSISNDGVSFSNQLAVTYYNSNCVLCDTANLCIPNPSSCTIGGVCYANGAVNFNNPCLVCNRTASQTAWSYTYEHSICWPAFDFPVYSLKVVGQTPQGFALKTVGAFNSLVSGDSRNALTYTINSTFSSLPFQIANDPQNSRLAVISTKVPINVATLDQSRLPATFTIYATDSYGDVATASAVVAFVTQDLAPTFNASTYGGGLPENATVGTPLLTVFATPGSISGTITYDWVLADPHFALNTTTGVISLAQPLDYSVATNYFLQVLARDPSGQFQIVDVRVNVTYIPKPPSNILLSANTLNEKMPANTVVAVLTTVDPGSVTFTYVISPANVPFVISGNQILSTIPLDYETGPSSYTFNLTTTDETGFILTKTITITLVNVIEPPQNVRVCPLTGCTSTPGLSIPDDTMVNELVGIISFTNPDNVPVTCRVFPNNSFGVVVQNGVNKVFLRAALDYRVSPTVYMFPSCSVIGNNGQPLYSADSQTVVTVVARPKAPQPANLTLTPAVSTGVPETQTSVLLGTVSSFNNDPTATNITFSLPADTTGSFQLSTPTCTQTNGVTSCSVQVTLVGPLPPVTFNSSGYGTTTVTVRSVDSGSGKFVDTVLTIPVQFVNQAPLAPTWVGGNTVMEGSPVNTVVGILQTNDVHVNMPQLLTVMGSNDFSVSPLTQTRRAVGAVRYAVTVKNPSLSFKNAQQVTLSINVSNLPPTGAPMSSVYTVSLNMAPRPQVASLQTAAALVPSAASANVNEKTAAGTSVGTLVLPTFDRADELTPSYTLVSDGNGYFALSGASLVRTSKFLLNSAAQTLNVTVVTSLTPIPNAPRSLPYVSSAVSYFTLNVLPVSDPPAFVFSNGLAALNVTIPVGALPNVQVIAQFQVSNVQNSFVTAVLSSDPSQLFRVVYDGPSDSLQIWLDQTPMAPMSYGPVIITATDASGHSVTGSMSVTVQAVILGGRNRFFEQSQKGSSMGSTGLAGIVVGAVVGIALVALLVAVVVIRRRKQALKMAIAKEPFYNTVGETGNLSNPTYLGQTDGFAPGLQNPMYAWYRPDMSRQETEEFLADQVDGAFVIRDSTATPGWHMLAVKTQNAIVHEKIKMSDDGLYELLPNSNRSQPRFGVLPELVEHYARPQDGVRYALALDNPLYDNNQMAQRKHGHAVAGAWSYHNDPSAPSVPLKEREIAVVQQIVEASGDELYTNSEEAKGVISSA